MCRCRGMLAEQNAAGNIGRFRQLAPLPGAHAFAGTAAAVQAFVQLLQATTTSPRQACWLTGQSIVLQQQPGASCAWEGENLLQGAVNDLLLGAGIAQAGGEAKHAFDESIALQDFVMLALQLLIQPDALFI